MQLSLAFTLAFVCIGDSAMERNVERARVSQLYQDFPDLRQRSLRVEEKLRNNIRYPRHHSNYFSSVWSRLTRVERDLLELNGQFACRFQQIEDSLLALSERMHQLELRNPPQPAAATGLPKFVKAPPPPKQPLAPPSKPALPVNATPPKTPPPPLPQAGSPPT